MPESCQELQPVVVCIGGADNDLYVRVDLPQLFDGLEPIPTRWHSHVDESDRVRTALGASRTRELDAIPTLHRGIHIESRARGVGLLLAEQPRFGLRRQRLPVGYEDLAVVLMNGRIVVDHKDAMRQQVGFIWHRATPATRTAALG